MKKPILVVMAAGIGSRFGGLKQIENVGPAGEIIIDYALFDAHRAGFERIIFIIRKDIQDAFAQRISANIRKYFSIEYAFQELNRLPPGFSVPAGRIKPWGTAHAVFCAKELIDSPFAVINADDFYGAHSFANLYSHLSKSSGSDGLYDFCMVGYRLENTLTEYGHVARGICTATTGGELDTIVERTKIQRFGSVIRYENADEWVDVAPETIVSMNMFGFTEEFCNELEIRLPEFLQKNINNPKAEYFLPSVVNELVAGKKARVRILPTSDSWLGVTYKEDLNPVRTAIQRLIKNGAYPSRLWS
jgi:NDP-sugar pyrophosphorylase family protein